MAWGKPPWGSLFALGIILYSWSYIKFYEDVQHIFGLMAVIYALCLRHLVYLKILVAHIPAFHYFRDCWLRDQNVWMYWVEPHTCCHNCVFHLISHQYLGWHFPTSGGIWMVSSFIWVIYYLLIPHMLLVWSYIPPQGNDFCIVLVFLLFSTTDHICWLRPSYDLVGEERLKITKRIIDNN